MDWRPSELDPYPRAERDLGSAALWSRSQRRSHERRRRKAAARRNAPRQKGATLAAGAAVFASPLLGPVTGATAASSPPGVTTAQVAERAAVSGEDTWLLSYGDTGDAVAAVQRHLSILEDGIFGPQTEGAVKDFQQLKGLPATGVVDARTWAELFDSKVLFYDEGASASSVQVAYEPQAAPEPAPADANDFVDVAPEPVAHSGPVSEGGPDVEDRVELRDEVTDAPAPAPEAAPEEAPASVPVSTGDGCAGSMSAPVDGTLTGSYGEDRGDHAHSGIDLAAPTGTTVRAAECGTVSESGTESGYGTMVCVRHAGETTTCYAHLSERSVAVNEYVRAGQKIGEVGCTGSCTGPHVHFEVRENGQAQDPTPYLRGGRTATAANESTAIGGPTPEEQAQVFAQTDGAPEPTPTGGVAAPVAADATPAEVADAVARTAVQPPADPAAAPAEAPAATPVDGAAPAAEAPAVEAPAVDPAAQAPAVEPAVEAPAVDPAAQAPAVEPAVEAPVEAAAPAPAVETPAAEPAVEAPAPASAVEAPVEAPAPAPAVEAPAPAPAVEAPAPAPAVEAPVEAPAPAPVEAAPAPAAEPAVEAPAPAPEPAVEAPAPEPAVEAPAPEPAAAAPAAEPAVEEAPAGDPAATGGAAAPAG